MTDHPLTPTNPLTAAPANPTPQPILDPDPNTRGELTDAQRSYLDELIHQERILHNTIAWFALGSFILCAALLWWLNRVYPDVTMYSVCAGPFGILAVLGFLVAQRREHLGQQYQEDVKTNRLETVSGQVVWKFFRYRMQAPRALHLYLPLQPRPGQFLFYYLPHSRRILRVQALGTPADCNQVLQTALMQVVHFDAGALQANRAGTLSKRQKQQLKQSLYVSILLAEILYLLVPAVGYYLYALFGTFRSPTGSSDTGTLVILGCFGIVLLIGLPFVLAGFVSRARAIRSGRVASIDGFGFTNSSPPQWRISYLNFPIGKYSRRALLQGLRYRAYYLPRTTQLLSIEALASENETQAAKHPLSQLSFADKYALDLNRTGRMTEMQSNALFNRWARPIVPVVSAIVFVLAILGAIFQTYDLILPIPFWLLLFVLALSAYIYFRKFNWLTLPLDLMRQKVVSAEGTLRRIAASPTYDMYVVGERTLILPRTFRSDPTFPLIAGQRYRVYFVPKSNVTINLEYLGTPVLPPAAEPITTERPT